MHLLIALLVGALIASAVWNLLSRDLYKLVLGIMLLVSAVNLFVFAAGRLGPRSAPLVDAASQSVNPELVANPLPQAIVLTAIVIGFAVFIFLLVLVRSADRDLGNLDIDTMQRPKKSAEHEP